MLSSISGISFKALTPQTKVSFTQNDCFEDNKDLKSDTFTPRQTAETKQAVEKPVEKPDPTSVVNSMFELLKDRIHIGIVYAHTGQGPSNEYDLADGFARGSIANFGYCLKDAARKGISIEDLAEALINKRS
jgi:hypothetical protein